MRWLLNKKFIMVGYLLSVFSLFLYSFTQIDLGLTFSQASFFQLVQKNFQYIGYFNRPLSAIFFFLILVFLFAFYFLILFAVKKKEFNIFDIKFLIISTSVVLFFAYSAFSYDIFNYIFDAKIFTHYGLNPYEYKALDFPKDPMLSFMHWTHRTYPYGPVWLAISIPFSYLGFNFFIPTFYLFKLVAVSFFLGNTFFLWKILKKTSSNPLFNVAFFALNPIVLIEVLTSAHNDISMIFFATLGVYFLLNKKWTLSFISIIISYLIKEVTILLLIPAVIYFIASRVGKFKFGIKNFSSIVVMVMIAGFAYVLTKKEVQPWYFLWIFSFLPLIKLNRAVIVLINGVCLGLLLRYVPYLYLGNWDGAAIQGRLYLTLAAPLLSGFFLLSYYVFHKTKKSLKV